MATGWLETVAEEYGAVIAGAELQPATPWMAGVSAFPGPTFYEGGFDENVIDGQARIGKIVDPDASDLLEWVTNIVYCIGKGLDPDGGWSPTRSVVVEWTPGGDHYFYKAVVKHAPGQGLERDISYPARCLDLFTLGGGMDTLTHIQDAFVKKLDEVMKEDIRSTKKFMRRVIKRIKVDKILRAEKRRFKQVQAHFNKWMADQKTRH